MFEFNIYDYLYFGSLTLLLLLGIIYLVYYVRSQQPLFSGLSISQQIRNIVTVALFSAISTVILIFFTKMYNITLIPVVRIPFEGILVKIAGFVFGPIVGIISACVTELAVIMFVPTYFHYKYLIVLIAFGFFAGLVKVAREKRFTDKWSIITLSMSIILFMVLTILFFWYRLDNSLSLGSTTKWNRFYEHYFQTWSFRTILFWIDLCLFVFLLIGVIFLYFVKSHKYFYTRFLVQHRTDLISVLCLTIFAEYLVSVFISTSANVTVFGESSRSLEAVFLTALVVAPIKIMINTVIIFSVYRITKLLTQRVHNA